MLSPVLGIAGMLGGMRALGSVVLAAWVLVGCGGQSADLVLRGGKVVTLDEAMPEAEAVAVVGDRIAAVGSDAEIESWIGASTEVIDLEGRLAIPGFIEAHGHLMKIGRAAVSLPLAEAESWDEIVEMVRRAADDAERPHPGGQGTEGLPARATGQQAEQPRIPSDGGVDRAI